MIGTDSGPSPLRRSVVSGVKWGALSAAVVFAIGLVQTSILARLLDPSDFGLVAASLVVIGLARAFADLGLSSAIIARQMSDPKLLSSLYWASLIVGVLIALVVAAFTPLAVRFFDEPGMATILPLAALSFMIIPVGQQFQMLLQKELRVDRLVKIDIASAVVGLVAGTAAALAGAGAASLVIALLARLATAAASFAAWGWRVSPPRLRLRRRDLDGVIGFGLYQMGERFVNYLSANVDYIVIGRHLGAQALGVYSVAYQLVVRPVFELNPILTRVSFPAFAKRQNDDDALCRGYLEVIRLIGFIVVPMMAGLAIVAPVFVPVVLGDQWGESVVLLQILAVVGAARSLTSPSGDMLLAKGRPDMSFKLNTLYLTATIVVLVIAVRYGLVAVASCFAALSVFDFVLFSLALHRVIGLQGRQLARVLGWPVVNSAGMAVAVLAVDRLARDSVDSRLVLLVVELVTGVVVYGLLVTWTERGYVKGLIAMMRPPRSLDPSGSS